MVISESHDSHRHSGRPLTVEPGRRFAAVGVIRHDRLLLIDFITVILYAIFYGVNCVNKCI